MLSDDEADELALLVGLEWSDSDRELLSPLIDLVIVWADERDIVPVAAPILLTLWADDLRDDIQRALEHSAEQSSRVAKLLPRALSDLDSGPERSRLAYAFVRQAAHEFAGADLLPVHCLLCLEDVLAATPPGERQGIAARAARIAAWSAGFTREEIHAAVSAATLRGAAHEGAALLATDDRRLAVRARVARLAEVGARSLPTLSHELRALVEVPLPTAGDDPLWHEAVRAAIGDLGAEWN